MKKSELRISLYKKEPNINSKTYTIENINDLYQVATLENIDKLFNEIKAIFILTLSAEKGINETEKKLDEKLTIKKVEWIDD